MTGLSMSNASTVTACPHACAVTALTAIGATTPAVERRWSRCGWGAFATGWCDVTGETHRIAHAER